MTARFPAEHAEFIARCAAFGQSSLTPLLLQWAPFVFVAKSDGSGASTGAVLTV